MSTCAKRSVLQMGDRPGLVLRAALEVQSAANQFVRRQMPAAGGTGRAVGMQPYGRPMNHSRLQGNSNDPYVALARAVSGLGGASANAARAPQGPVGWTGGRPPNATAGNGTGTGTGGPIGGGVPGPGAPGTFTEGRFIMLNYSGPYTEPMLVPLPPNFTPVAMTALRITAQGDPLRYFRSGVACDYIPFGANALIRTIDGMTVAPTPDPTILDYVFAFYGVQN